jgi:hypothetical protein
MFSPGYHEQIARRCYEAIDPYTTLRKVLLEEMGVTVTWQQAAYIASNQDFCAEITKRGKRR